MASFLQKVFGSHNDRVLKKIVPTVERVNSFESELVLLSDDGLRSRTAVFRQRIENGEPLDDLLPEAFATVREAAKRTLGQRHYDVQIIGGVVLHQGCIAEMKTVEGKTLDEVKQALPSLTSKLEEQARAFRRMPCEMHEKMRLGPAQTRNPKR